MPFSKTPQQSTYQQKFVPFLQRQNNRGIDPTKDADMLNCFIELDQDKATGTNEFHITKRPGCSQYIAPVGGTIRGHHYNQDFQKLFYAVGNSLYVYNVATNTLSATLVGVFSTVMGDVGFSDYLYDSGQQVVVITDGTTLLQIDSTNTVTTCTDPDLPVPHQPYPVFLDGYIFVLKSGTGDLYNSNLNNPMQWTAGDFISCEIDPDQTIRPIKLNNYIVVFGTKSIEYFWDAANTSGSPLQRNDTPVKFNGYLGGYAQFGNRAYFVGNNVEGQPSVFMLEDLKMEPLVEATWTRYLSNLTQTYSTYKGSVVCTAGHTFYLLNAGPYTYVADLETKQWFRWAFQQGTGFPMDGAVNVKTTNSYKCLFFTSTDATYYQFSPLVYQDAGVSFTAQVVTDNQEFETRNQKVLTRAVVWADRPSSTSLCTLYWSDDDYQTWSTGRDIDLYLEQPETRALGRFRRRAFKMYYTQNEPMRFKGLEVFVNLGQN